MIPKSIMDVISHINKNGGKALIVGGAVRDFVLGITPKDFDIEVSSLSFNELQRVLSTFGKVDLVGASFGIIKLCLNGEWIDISMPRRENKVGSGHKGFAIESDPNMTPKEAAFRRDFRMNSMMYDPSTNELIDPYNGKRDIENKIISHTSHHFFEDPLRVLRAVQFSARFDFDIHPLTAIACKDMVGEFSQLPKERIREELMKFFLKGKYVRKGMEALVCTSWIKNFKELDDLRGCKQEFEWHPEGDVWEHTIQVMEIGIVIAKRESLTEKEKLVLLLACMCHDLGKPITTAEENGRITSKGHAETGILLTNTLLKTMGFEDSIISEVVPLVKEHLIHTNPTSITEKGIRRLSLRVQPSNIRMLSLLIEADHSGRGFLSSGMPESMQKILDIASSMNVESDAMKPLVLGRHLIPLGIKPGQEMGNILRCIFEAQIDGAFNDVEGGILWFKNEINRP